METTVLTLMHVIVLAATCVSVSPRVAGYAKCQLLSPTADGILQFHDTSEVETAYDSEYKEISCFANNFCDITWKNGGAKIDPGQDVQRIKFTSVNISDNGQYTCTATNGKENITQTITLHVIDEVCLRDVKPIRLSHQGCSNSSSNIGGSVTFTCEFYIGLNDGSADRSSWFKINETALANNASKWDYLLPLLPLYKKGMLGGVILNETLQYSGKFDEKIEQKCPCNCSPNALVELRLDNISQEALGIYALDVRYNEYNSESIKLFLSEAILVPPPTVKPEDIVHLVLIIAGCSVLCGFLAAISWHRFKTDIKLFYKDKIKPVKMDDKKTCDVYLSYDWDSEMDRGFAMSLVKRLEDQGYRVFCENDSLPGGDTDEDILAALETSWRCVIIFSPDYLASRRQLDLTFAMDRVKHYKEEIIPIIYRDISLEDSTERDTLSEHALAQHCLRYDRIPTKPPSIIKKIVHSVFGDSRSEKSLHKELLLRLPPREKFSSQVLDDAFLAQNEFPVNVSSEGLYSSGVRLSQIVV